MKSLFERTHRTKTMTNILFINSCVRSGSRTKRLADCLLSKLKEQAEDRNEQIRIEEVCTSEIPYPEIDEAFLQRRDALLAAGAYDDPLFSPARQFAAADCIVIAAPYWDLSFPASLKRYFELINVTGITFKYTPEGYPQSLCRAASLYYVMTAGGTFVPEEYGYGYIKSLAQNFYGIQDIRLIQAVGLDIDGADPEAILQESMLHAVSMLSM